MDSNELGATFTAMVGRSVRVSRIGGGRNAQVYRLDSDGSAPMVAKRYFTSETDTRDRLSSEVAALQFLVSAGLTCVPKVIAVDRAAQCIVLEYIEGDRVSPRDATSNELDQLIEFLCKLHQLRNHRGANSLPMASEACLCMQDIVANINSRLELLRQASEIPSPNRDSLIRFIDENLQPRYEAIRTGCFERFAQWGLDIAHPLPRERQTLSPSDFGLHNAIRRPGGEMAFIDFEYFGFDDPAKLISDVLLHPASEGVGRGSLRNEISWIATYSDAELPLRLRGMYPLFAIKWCIILLNEFIPAEFERRLFSGSEKNSRGVVQMAQLRKAELMLSTAKAGCEQFPYVI